MYVNFSFIFLHFDNFYKTSLVLCLIIDSHFLINGFHTSRLEKHSNLYQQLSLNPVNILFYN